MEKEDYIFIYCRSASEWARGAGHREVTQRKRGEVDGDEQSCVLLLRHMHTNQTHLLMYFSNIKAVKLWKGLKGLCGKR